MGKKRKKRHTPQKRKSSHKPTTTEKLKLAAATIGLIKAIVDMICDIINWTND